MAPTDCRACGGRGRFEDDKCPECDGEGLIWHDDCDRHPCDACIDRQIDAAEWRRECEENR